MKLWYQFQSHFQFRFSLKGNDLQDPQFSFLEDTTHRQLEYIVCYAIIRFVKKVLHLWLLTDLIFWVWIFMCIFGLFIELCFKKVAEKLEIKE